MKDIEKFVEAWISNVIEKGELGKEWERMSEKSKNELRSFLAVAITKVEAINAIDNFIFATIMGV